MPLLAFSNNLPPSDLGTSDLAPKRRQYDVSQGFLSTLSSAAALRSLLGPTDETRRVPLKPPNDVGWTPAAFALSDVQWPQEPTQGRASRPGADASWVGNNVAPPAIRELLAFGTEPDPPRPRIRRPEDSPWLGTHAANFIASASQWTNDLPTPAHRWPTHETEWLGSIILNIVREIVPLTNDVAIPAYRWPTHDVGGGPLDTRSVILDELSQWTNDVLPVWIRTYRDEYPLDFYLRIVPPTGPFPSTQVIIATSSVRAIITEVITMSGINLYVGDVSFVTCTVTDQNGALQDPGVVTANVQTPDKVVTAQSVTRISKGIYQFTYTWLQQFGYTVQFQGTNPYPFNVYQPFAVLASPF